MFLEKIFCKKRNHFLKCPLPTSNSYEIASDGPISIWHFGDNTDNDDQYAFQIIREPLQMFFVTENHQTTIVAQSTVPIYIPSYVHVTVIGKNVTLFVHDNCNIKTGRKKRKFIVKDFEIPQSQIIVIHRSASIQNRFKDFIQVFIADDTVAYCAGKNRITLSNFHPKIIVKRNSTEN